MQGKSMLDLINTSENFLSRTCVIRTSLMDSTFIATSLTSSDEVYLDIFYPIYSILSHKILIYVL